MKNIDYLKNKIKKLFFNQATDEDLREISQFEFLEKEFKKQWDESETYPSDTLLGKHIWDKIESQINPYSIKLSMRSLWIGTAAMLALISLVGLGSFWMGKKDIEPIYSTLVEVYSGGNLRYQLPDHSVVWMQPNTTLKFSKKFEDNREVWLDGESIFEVEKRDGLNFKVHLEQSTIEVLGTKFGVKKLANANGNEVALYEGRIKFNREDNGQNLILNPGQTLFYNRDELSLEVVSTPGFAWKEGKYVFEDIRIDSLIYRLNAHYHADIKLTSSIDASFRLNGAIAYDESIEKVLYKICYALNAQYKEDKGRITIEKKEI